MKKIKLLDDYIVLQTLGRGGFGKVKKIYSEKQKIYYAAKIFIESSDLLITVKNLKTFTNEIQFLQNINHENIIKVIDFKKNGIYNKNGEQKKVTYIIYEYAEGGLLFDYVKQQKFSEEISRCYFEQLLDALEYMHQKGICHRDIKLDNLLLDREFNLKIGDFGFATLFKDENNEAIILRDMLGTRFYRAPEIRMKKEHKGDEVDIFAAGVCLFIMISGFPPFSEAISSDRHYDMIINEKYDLFWKFYEKFHPKNYYKKSFKELINKMLAFNPANRLKIEDIKNHPWMKEKKDKISDIQIEFKYRQNKLCNDFLQEKKAKIEKKLQDLKETENKQKNYEFVLSKNSKRNIGFFENSEINFEYLEEIFQNDLIEENKRYLIKKEEEIFYNNSAFYTCINEEVLLRYLLYFLIEEIDPQNIKIHQNTYKIDFVFFDIEQTTIKIRAIISKIDENSIVLEFKKLSGSLISYTNIRDQLLENLIKILK